MEAHFKSASRAAGIPGQRARQAGFAAALLLVILVMGSLYALLTSINTATAELQQKRDATTMAALRQAKEALIVWSVTASQGPGHLPCPDRDNDGDSEGAACATPATRIGLLPWRTLGLPDLRDASGERLWYVVSGNFVNQLGNPINSDTQGQLTVTGLSPANNVIAIVFAPGPAVAAQNRGGPDTGFGVPKTTVGNYLENQNGDALNDLFVALRRCEQTDCPVGPFNDQLAVITHAELFDVVENAVARRIETEVVPVVNAYYTAWNGAYPYAAPYSANPTAPLAGGQSDPALYDGLLPTDGNPSWIRWESCDPTNLSPFGVSESHSPSGSPSSGQACTLTFSYSGPSPPTIRFTLETRQSSFTSLGYVGRAFFGRYDATSKLVRVDRHNTGASPGDPLVTVTSGPGTYSGVTSVSTLSNGQGRIRYQINASTNNGTITVQVFPPIISDTLSSATTGPLQWFFANNWHRLTYYRIAQNNAVGRPGCDADPTPPCLTVNGPGTATTQARMVLVLAGRALSSQDAARSGLAAPVPPDAAYLGNFFEGANVEAPAPGDGTFARQLRSLTFNDRVVVVAP